MKRIMIIMVALMLFACENESEHVKGIYSYGGGNPTVCLNGVVYYTFNNRMAPAFGTDSKVILCDSDINIRMEHWDRLKKEVDKDDQK